MANIDRERKESKEVEFYTQLPDIEDELQHYKEHFKDQVVYCNCDDPLESNFFIYFVKHFRELGLKKLITTCFDGSPIAGSQLLLDFEETRKNPKRVAYKIEVDDVEEFSSADGEITFWDVADALRSGTGKAKLEKLRGNGDFQSEECVRLLDESDIVVTNPPFAPFKEFIPLIAQKGRRFLVLGPDTGISYKSVYTLIEQKKLWFGTRYGTMEFTVPKYAKLTKTRSRVDENGQKWRSMGNICWYTNMEHHVPQAPIPLLGTYTPEEYPKYDNYDAIDVGKKEIPGDYDGIMGVTIGVIPRAYPDQFEIVKFRTGNNDKDLSVNGKCPFFRVLVRKRQHS